MALFNKVDPNDLMFEGSPGYIAAHQNAQTVGIIVVALAFALGYWLGVKGPSLSKQKYYLDHRGHSSGLHFCWHYLRPSRWHHHRLLGRYCSGHKLLHGQPQLQAQLDRARQVIHLSILSILSTVHQ
jgi:hypothetical protein